MKSSITSPVVCVFAVLPPSGKPGVVFAVFRARDLDGPRMPVVEKFNRRLAAGVVLGREKDRVLLDTVVDIAILDL